MYDLLFKDAMIYDGSGSPAFVGCVGILDGKIAYVGKNTAEFSARETINADRLCLSLGFIDSHSHSDRAILEDPIRLHVLRMGATTEIAGQCG